MSIFITGDIHGNPRRFNVDEFPEQKEMSKNDVVIILGDFGLVWDFRGENKEERYWLDWLDQKPFTTLFIDGNHDNFDRLYSYPVENWHGGTVHFIRPSVIHLMRGQIFSIQDHTFFAFGGASSHDISDGILEIDDPDFKSKIKKLLQDPDALFRIDHFSWWERELPTEEEMKCGLKNLDQKNRKVDYILTHSPYTSLLKQMDGGSGLYQKDVLTDYLENIRQTVDFKYWFFGHMHVDQDFYGERSFCLYEQIMQIS